MAKSFEDILKQLAEEFLLKNEAGDPTLMGVNPNLLSDAQQLAKQYPRQEVAPKEHDEDEIEHDFSSLTVEPDSSHGQLNQSIYLGGQDMFATKSTGNGNQANVAPSPATSLGA